MNENYSFSVFSFCIWIEYINYDTLTNLSQKVLNMKTFIALVLGCSSLFVYAGPEHTWLFFTHVPDKTYTLSYDNNNNHPMYTKEGCSNHLASSGGGWTTGWEGQPEPNYYCYNLGKTFDFMMHGDQNGVWEDTTSSRFINPPRIDNSVNWYRYVGKSFVKNKTLKLEPQKMSKQDCLLSVQEQSIHFNLLNNKILPVAVCVAVKKNIEPTPSISTSKLWHSGSAPIENGILKIKVSETISYNLSKDAMYKSVKIITNYIKGEMDKQQ